MRSAPACAMHPHAHAQSTCIQMRCATVADAPPHPHAQRTYSKTDAFMPGRNLPHRPRRRLRNVDGRVRRGVCRRTSSQYRTNNRQTKQTQGNGEFFGRRNACIFEEWVNPFLKALEEWVKSLSPLFHVVEIWTNPFPENGLRVPPSNWGPFQGSGHNFYRSSWKRVRIALS